MLQVNCSSKYYDISPNTKIILIMAMHTITKRSKFLSKLMEHSYHFNKAKK
jgi:hypothetical protein